VSQSFHNAVVKSSEFRDFAQANFETILIDTSKRTFAKLDEVKAASYAGLVSRYGITQFPTVIIMTPTGKFQQAFEGYDRKGAHIYVRELTRAVKPELAGVR